MQPQNIMVKVWFQNGGIEQTIIWVEVITSHLLVV